ncbi:MAG: PAC2 family protein [Actinobacteria bacterium]|nr:PAC2 family protein [Actinomycetota bacterium]
MHLSESSFSLRSPILIAAFEGWNDAAESATSAITHLLTIWSHQQIAVVDSEEYYDFQVNRPQIKIDQSNIREIIWPGTIVYAVSSPALTNDFLIVRGVEPSMRWKSFISDLLDLADDYEVSMIISIGALLADTPHSRPFNVAISGAHPEVSERFGLEISRYEGPTGIIGVLQDGAYRREIDAISLWAAVPHYVATPPCPKAALALINALEDFLEVSLPLGDLPERAKLWEAQVDQMAADDAEVGDYVRQLESSKDSAELPEISGESIAREVERFLRRNPGI